MKKIIYSLFFISIISVFHRTDAAAKTYMTVDPNESDLGPFVQFDDTSDLEAEFTGLARIFFSKNIETLPTGMAAAGNLGYPNGIAIIEPFPHFECGASAGGSIYKAKAERRDEFDEHDIEGHPSAPGVGINGGFFFGTGLTDRIDIIGKFFSLGWFLSKSYTYDAREEEGLYIKLGDYDVYSFGVKTRYNLVKRRKSSLFSFGGLSANIALDYLKYKFNAIMEYTKSEEQGFKINDPFSTGDPVTKKVILEGTLNGSVNMNSNFFSVTPEMFVYFDVLYFLGLYTGPSVSFVSGTLAVNVDTRGSLINMNDLTIDSYTMDMVVIPAGTDVGTAELISRNKMHPSWIIPRWTVGLEIRMWTVNLLIEASSILTSIKDSFTGQVGLSVRI